MPRFAIGQADDRPSLTIAVQKISTSNTLEPMREQSNVGQRIFCTFAETLSDHAWTGDRSLRPGLADTFRRIDARALELKLRENVRFHNGDGMTAEDVAFSFGLERMWTGQWENEEMPRLMEALQDSTDMDKRRATFRRMLTLTEREAPAYNGIHQNATFTAKRRNYKWRRGAVVRGRLPREQLGLGLTSSPSRTPRRGGALVLRGREEARLSSTAPG